MNGLTLGLPMGISCCGIVGGGNGCVCVAEPKTLATIWEGVMPTTGTLGWGKDSPLDMGYEAGAGALKTGWRGGIIGTAAGRVGMKAT